MRFKIVPVNKHIFMNKLLLVALLIALVASMHLKGHQAEDAATEPATTAAPSEEAPASSADESAAPAATDSNEESSKSAASEEPATTAAAEESAAPASSDSSSNDESASPAAEEAATTAAADESAKKADDSSESAEPSTSAAAADEEKPAETAPASDESAASSEEAAPASSDEAAPASSDEAAPASSDEAAPASDSAEAAASNDEAAAAETAPEKKHVKYFVEPFTDRELLIRQELERHNELRARHGAKPIEEDADLTKAAQQWADQLVIDGKLSHSSGARAGYYGENLYKASGFLKATLESNWEADNRDYDLTPFDTYSASNKWYSEVDNFDFEHHKDTGNKDKPSGHFSAMVWKGVKKAGFGYGWQKQANSEMFDLYVVARYTPVPRVLGQYNDNVSPASTSAEESDNE